MAFGEAYRRWRHTRGYGVHSPFAYSVVKEVVRPARGYAYYGYDDIDNAFIGDGRGKARRHARTLHRLAAFLDVESSFMPNDPGATPFLTALRTARSDIKIVTALAEASTCRMVATTGDYMPAEALAEFIRTPGKVLCMHNAPDGWLDMLFDALPEGLMLHSRHDAILIHRPQMAKVAYSIIL